MSQTYENTDTGNDEDTRGLGQVEVSSPAPAPAPAPAAAPATATTPATTPASVAAPASTDPGSTAEVARDEARATGEQARDGARHVAEVGKDEARNVARETGQQAKDMWQQTRTQLLDQSAEQQTRVAQGLRSLGQELSGMAHASEQKGVATDLAHQASQRIEEVAGWLDERDPGSLVSEVKQFARQRPGTFLATAAVIGLVGGRLSRGLVADHQDGESSDTAVGAPAGAVPTSVPVTSEFPR